MLHFHLPFQAAKRSALACSVLCHGFEPPLNINSEAAVIEGVMPHFQLPSFCQGNVACPLSLLLMPVWEDLAYHFTQRFFHSLKLSGILFLNRNGKLISASEVAVK